MIEQRIERIVRLSIEAYEIMRPHIGAEGALRIILAYLDDPERMGRLIAEQVEAAGETAGEAARWLAEEGKQ